MKKALALFMIVCLAVVSSANAANATAKKAETKKVAA